MSPKPALTIAARMPKADAEARIRELEARAEARGSGIAGESVQTFAPSVPQRASGTDVQTPRAVVRRRGGRLRRRRTIYLPPDLDRRLATFCASNGRETSETIAEAVAVFLAGQR